MKNIIVKALSAILISTMLAGSHSMALTDDRTVTKITNSYLNMHTVTSYSGNNKGLQLYTDDGNGYYLEVTQKVENNQPQIFNVNSRQDHFDLLSNLQKRDGSIVIEISKGTVSDIEGNGVDASGYYRHYDTSKFSVGDSVQSVFIYNPDTNYIDDIICRVDTLIK